ncbi:MAG: hypothetical protein ACK4RS_07180 [Thiothrix sp.]
MRSMKVFLGMVSLATVSLYAADTAPLDTQNEALVDLCKAYAQEDGIATGQQARYLQDCLANLSALSEQVQNSTPRTDVPLLSAVVTKSSPETLVQNELVDKPDPSAEELSAKK